jgi:hypothetical protein
LSAIFGAAGLIDRGDAGVTKARERLGLAVEPAAVFFSGERVAAHDFERDEPAGRFLLGLKDPSLSAAADHAMDGVVANAAGPVHRRVGRSAGHIANQREHVS